MKNPLRRYESFPYSRRPSRLAHGARYNASPPCGFLLVSDFGSQFKKPKRYVDPKVPNGVGILHDSTFPNGPEHGQYP